MKVSVVRSGGVAGMRREASLDTDTLEPRQAEKLRRLVAKADLANLAEPTLRVGRGADRFHYTLTVEEGERQETITFAEEKTPGRLKPLLETLWRDGEPPPTPSGAETETEE